MRNPDRRQSPRTVVQKILCIQIEPDNHAIVLNVSDGGLGFHAFKAVVPTGAIQFSFSQTDHQRIQATGELVWRDETRKTGGLRFTPISAATREQIRNWALQADATAASEVSPVMPIPEPTYPVPASDLDGPKPSAPTTSQRFPDPMSLFQPEIPRPLLLNDIPAEYQSDLLGSADLRPKFFRGFMTGSVVSALAMAVLFFAYGRQINDALAQLRSNVGTQPTLENMQVRPMPSVTPIPPTPAVAPPSTAALDSQTASDTQATATARAASARHPVAAGLPKAHSDLRQTIEPAGSISGDSKMLESRNAAPVGALDDTGKKELAIAQGYLRNRGGSADGAAVAFLWSAVEKGNSTAEVTLAELYVRGEGVTRNCDQARVLLYAAASKGNNEADKQLAQIARGGCN